MGDPILLAELLKNLLSNAVSYAGRGAIVTLKVRQDARHVILEIEDNGPGLSPEQRAAAVRSRRGMTRPLPVLAKGQTTGMGLGLAIAVEISDLFGATIELEKAHQGTGSFGQSAPDPRAGLTSRAPPTQGRRWPDMDPRSQSVS